MSTFLFFPNNKSVKNYSRFLLILVYKILIKFVTSPVSCSQSKKSFSELQILDSVYM